ncbi:MAG: glycosyltransferase family 2 protein [Deltaproteobacteria bacterium]|nr:MAG: glycosyltransferase family 2 protein [Deltaproteobacteria bacterium]
MSQLESRASEAEPTAATTPVPSVLVIVVAKDGEGWLPDCLLSLSRQAYRRMAVVGVDNGSSDRSREILESALGADRVLEGGEQRGFAGAVGLAMRTDAAREADYLLLLHDDAMLAPDAIVNLVDAAERVGGVGIAGPKILDAIDRRVLRQIGMSTDRFGYPYSPLEAGEIDQGQYDRIREVRFVSSCAMLVAKDAWAKIGPPDERFTHALEDLDFCWRAQLAGFHVLMAPAAVAFHRRASVRGERAGSPRPARARYYRERGALASVLKNYGILSLVWVLPLYILQGLVRLSLLLGDGTCCICRGRSPGACERRRRVRFPTGRSAGRWRPRRSAFASGRAPPPPGSFAGESPWTRTQPRRRRGSAWRGSRSRIRSRPHGSRRRCCSSSPSATCSSRAGSRAADWAPYPHRQLPTSGSSFPACARPGSAAAVRRAPRSRRSGSEASSRSQTRRSSRSCSWSSCRSSRQPVAIAWRAP